MWLLLFGTCVVGVWEFKAGGAFEKGRRWRKRWSRGHQYHCQGLCRGRELQHGKEETPKGSATSEHCLVPIEDATNHIHGRGLKGCRPFRGQPHGHKGRYWQFLYHEDVSGSGEFGGHPLLEDIQKDEDSQRGDKVVRWSSCQLLRWESWHPWLHRAIYHLQRG